jgi:uncharacterized protein YjbI with pentapeptide repeats
MGAKLRSWRQQIKKHPVASVLVALFVVLSVLVILGGYKFNWDWTGFNRPSKTLWDWLQLISALAIPVVVGFGAVWFTTRQGKTADAENKDNQRETALQAYIDNMSELLLEKKLRDSAEEDEVRKIARVRTMTIFPRLDATRKSSVLLFLHESGLIDKDKYIIDLSGANLSGANLRTDNLSAANLQKTYLGEANLVRADLSEAILREADLSRAVLMGADLGEADLSRAVLIEANLNGADLSGATLYEALLQFATLSGATLSGANLSEANLSEANLSEANLEEANLKGVTGITIEELEKQAKSLEGATMPDGSIHP